MERIVKRFKSPRHLQRFVSIHDQIANLFHFPRHSLDAADCQPLRAEAMVAWKELLASAPQYNLSARLHLGFALTQSS